MTGSQEQLHQYVCDTVDSLTVVADALLSEYSGSKVFLFYGEMGAGKTTFINVLCKQLQVKDGTSSPSFSIVNEYLTASGDKVYHFDFYRIKNEYEALDIGFEEYLYSGDYCFIEWPEKINNFLPVNAVTIKIEVQEGKRIFKIWNR
jgi:tRNA threonylcarbamoyladenosine biosynthesis protein TsaE